MGKKRKIIFGNKRTKFKIDSSNKEFNLNNTTGLFFIAICSNSTIENIDNKLQWLNHVLRAFSLPQHKL